MRNTKNLWSGMLATALAVPMVALAPKGALSQDSPHPDAARIAYVGRLVTDLENSTAFYEKLGLKRVPDTSTSTWHRDAALEKLFGTRGIETREAIMETRSNVSTARFDVHLIEVRGVRRKDLSDHMPWEPGATHFGLVVPDAQRVWDGMRAAGVLRARSWGGELVSPPGQTKGMLAYMTDPDGLDIELIDERPNRPAGVSHVGLIPLDSSKARRFYETFLGGVLQSKEAPWLSGDFYDSAVGGHGNILRFYNLAFPEAAAPTARMNMELVEFQNRKKPVRSYRITDRGLGYLALEVSNLDTAISQALQLGAHKVSGDVVTRGGARQILLRDPDTGAFILLLESANKAPVS